MSFFCYVLNCVVCCCIKALSKYYVTIFVTITKCKTTFSCSSFDIMFLQGLIVGHLLYIFVRKKMLYGKTWKCILFVNLCILLEKWYTNQKSFLFSRNINMNNLEAVWSFSKIIFKKCLWRFLYCCSKNLFCWRRRALMNLLSN